MKNKRIVEVIDSIGESMFYPEHKVLGILWWTRYGITEYGHVRFNDTIST